LHPKRTDEPHLERVPPPTLGRFDAMIDEWFPLTYMLNNLNRGLGLTDSYPFVLSGPAVDKLRLVHDVATEASKDVPNL